jgi:hypothetical protein
VFNAVIGAEISRLDDDGDVYAVAFSPDGTGVAADSGCVSGDGSGRVFVAATGHRISPLDLDRDLHAVVFNRDGTLVATGSRRLWRSCPLAAARAHSPARARDPNRGFGACPPDRGSRLPLSSESHPELQRQMIMEPAIAAAAVTVVISAAGTVLAAWVARARPRRVHGRDQGSVCWRLARQQGRVCR